MFCGERVMGEREGRALDLKKKRYW